MNIRKFINGSLAALTLVFSVAFGGGQAHAQSAQIPWNGGNLPSIEDPVFNIYTGMPYGNGNEADFVRLRESTGDPTVTATASPFRDPVSVSCEDGDMFDVRTYMHNGADDDLNDNGDGSAVAHNVRVTMHAPLNSEDDRFVFSSTISADNAQTISDTGTLNCGDEFTLTLVPNTVRIYSQPYGWRNLPDSAVGHEDITSSTPVGSPEFGSGDFWGCWQYVTVIVYTVEVNEIPEDDDDDRRPRRIVETGPGDIAGIFAATTLAGALAHRYILNRRYDR